MQSYEAGGAAAISVLTEEDFFDGSLDDLRNVARLRAIEQGGTPEPPRDAQQAPSLSPKAAPKVRVVVNRWSSNAERDRLIGWRAESNSGWILAAGGILDAEWWIDTVGLFGIHIERRFTVVFGTMVWSHWGCSSR